MILVFLQMHIWAFSARILETFLGLFSIFSKGSPPSMFLNPSTLINPVTSWKYRLAFIILMIEAPTNSMHCIDPGGRASRRALLHSAIGPLCASPKYSVIRSVVTGPRATRVFPLLWKAPTLAFARFTPSLNLGERKSSVEQMETFTSAYDFGARWTSFSATAWSLVPFLLFLPEWLLESTVRYVYSSPLGWTFFAVSSNLLVSIVLSCECCEPLSVFCSQWSAILTIKSVLVVSLFLGNSSGHFSSVYPVSRVFLSIFFSCCPLGMLYSGTGSVSVVYPCCFGLLI